MPQKLNANYITPHEASRLLGCGQQSIEAGLRNGTFPIGVAWYSGGPKNGQWNYRIPKAPLLRAIETGQFPRQGPCLGLIQETKVK